MVAVEDAVEEDVVEEDAVEEDAAEDAAEGAVMCCVLLVHGRCVMYDGGFAPCVRDAGGYASSAALYVGGRGG